MLKIALQVLGDEKVCINAMVQVYPVSMRAHLHFLLEMKLQNSLVTNSSQSDASISQLSLLIPDLIN